MEKKIVLVSVLVPIYGVEDYIERCIRSLLQQTYSNIEFVFVDDCTPDKSIEVLQKVLEDYPVRKPYVRIIRHKRNKGLGVSRNEAVNYASGDFIIHVDPDDYVERDMVEACINRQNETNADLVIVNTIIHHKTYNSYQKRQSYQNSKERTIALLERATPLSVVGMLIRKQLYVDNDHWH